MNFDILIFNITTILGNISLIFLLSLIYYKNVDEYKKYQEWNWTRVFLSLGIFVNFLDLFLKLIYYTMDFKFIQSEWMLDTVYELSILGILKGYTVVFGMIFVLYINQKDKLLLGPLFLYTGAIIMGFTANVLFYHIGFIFIIGILCLILLVQTGVSLKDNNSLGLAIMYIFIFLGGVMPNPNLGNLFRLSGYISGLMIISGLVKVYKVKEEEE